MDLNIEELRIQIDSNIPKDNDDIEKIDFNIDVLYHPLKKEVKESLNALPFFTADMEYPSYLDTLTYDKILEFFFNKVVFMKILVKYGDKPDTTDATDTTDANDTTVKDKTDFEEKNLQKTFQLLFPTKYPVYQNHYNSHDYVIKESRPISNYMMNYANPFVKKYFSYVKHQGKIYTFSRVYWINDFLNHPITHDIFMQFRHVNHLFETDQTDDKSKQSKQSKQSKNEEGAETQGKMNEEDSKIANFIQYLGKNERNASIRDFYRTLNRYRSTSQREQNIPYSFPIHNGLSKMIGSFLDLDKKTKKKEENDQTNKNPKNEDNNDFIRFLFYVEEKYYKQNSENNEERGNGDDKINNAMKVNFIYDNNNRNYRIVLLCEFFEGEVTDRNKSKVFCKYVDHKLGHLLEVLTEPAELREKFEWFLYSKRNALYSIDNKTIGRSVNRNIKFNRPNYTSQQQANVGKTDDNVNNLFKLPGLDIEDDENIKNLFEKYKVLASATATEQYDFREFVSNNIKKEIIQHMIDRNYRPTEASLRLIEDKRSEINIGKIDRAINKLRLRSDDYDRERLEVEKAILQLKDAIYEKMYEFENENYYKYEN
jgi:hypothetical protein